MASQDSHPANLVVDHAGHLAGARSSRRARTACASTSACAIQRTPS